MVLKHIEAFITPVDSILLPPVSRKVFDAFRQSIHYKEFNKIKNSFFNLTGTQARELVRGSIRAMKEIIDE